MIITKGESETKMTTKDFYYDLPPELIAQTPLTDRSASRLLVLNKESGEISHEHFYDIPAISNRVTVLL